MPCSIKLSFEFVFRYFVCAISQSIKPGALKNVIIRSRSGEDWNASFLGSSGDDFPVNKVVLDVELIWNTRRFGIQNRFAKLWTLQQGCDNQFWSI